MMNQGRKHAKLNVLSLRDAVLLLAHKTCNEVEADALYLTRIERDQSEDVALEKLILMLSSGSITATGFLGEKTRLPIKDKWETQQYTGFSKIRTTIPKESWERVRVNNAHNNYSEMWVRTPNGQYESVFLSRGEFEESFEVKIYNSAEENASKNEINGGNYIPPYMALMLDAIEHFKISETNQPLVETLLEWFRNQTIEGQKISENEAKKLASFVRLPASKKGGNRPWNTQVK